MLHPEWSYQAVIYEMNVRQLTPEGTLRAAAAKLAFLRDMGIDAVWLMPVYPIGAERAQGLAGLLLFDPRLLRRRPRAGDDGRFRRVCRRGAPPGHEGAARLGRQPHGARRPLGRREACRLVRARRRGRARRALGLDGHRQTQLREPRRVAGRGRRHGVLAAPARRRRFPLRHGDARARGVLE